jgi:hypothetical protein
MKEHTHPISPWQESNGDIANILLILMWLRKMIGVPWEKIPDVLSGTLQNRFV